MVTRCLACNRLNNNEEGISFHRFPKNANRKISWMTLLGIDKQISARAEICSNHFQKKDFVTRFSGRKFLRQNAFPIALGKELEVSPRYFIFDDDIKNASKSSPFTPANDDDSSSTWSAPEIENENFPNHENLNRFFGIKPEFIQKESECRSFIPKNEIGSSSNSSGTLSSADTLTASEVEDKMSRECQNMPRNFPFKNDGIERATGSQPLISPVKNESTTLSASENEHNDKYTSSTKRLSTFKEHHEKCLNASELNEDNIASSSILRSQHFVYDFNELRCPTPQLQSTAGPQSSLKDSFIHHRNPESSQIVPLDNIIKTETFDDSIRSPLETQSLDIVKHETFSDSITSPFEIVPSENCDLETTLVIPSKVVRYVGDLTVEHFSTPAEAKQNLKLMFATIEKQRKKIKTLNQKKRRLEKKVLSFKELVEQLQKDDLLSPKASRALINFTKSNSVRSQIDPKKVRQS